MTTTEMISLLKIQGSFPTAQDLFSNSDFLVLLDAQNRKTMLPLMLSLNDEYLLKAKEFTISQGTLYRIPTRAVGAMFRDLKYIDGSGNYSDINRLYEEDRGSGKSGFFIVGNSVELSPDFTSGSLRMAYFASLSRLVLPSDCGLIQSIDTGLNQVVVSAAPSTFANGVLTDLVQGENPYDLMSMDAALASVSGTTLSFSSLPDGLAVGDYVCLAKQSPVPLLPEELHPVLVQAALVSTLSSKKDKALDYESKVLERNIEDAISMLSPRAKNDSTKFRSGSLLPFISNRRF